MNMKKIVLAVAMASGMAMGAAHAASPDQGHGTVTFTGSIIDAPCSISPDTIDQTVNLGEISSVALKDGGTSQPRPFDIKLEQCDTTTLKTVQTTFTGAPSAGNPDLLGITGTAKGASIAITNGYGQVVTLGSPTPAQTLQDGNNTLEFSAYLQGDGASATIVPGSFQSVADFTLSYQ
ncbi:fimbrial protein [Enterobacter roggenkampii]|uniref:fimbrial protein n=1 Tax=Enterobacter roggenkampii TaxID=1812935 RepID=UPI0008DD6CDD|nr:fimbrial protein [Enterobacter roggenkampii]OHY43842.1 fimbria A protein [Enterobacter roggenkampii]OHY61150.1 fimbria A protein [Enterobacter roggenkampii]